IKLDRSDEWYTGHSSRAHAKKKLGRYEEAIEDFKIAAKNLKPYLKDSELEKSTFYKNNFIDCRNDLGFSYLLQKKPKEAEDNYNKALELDKDNQQARQGQAFSRLLQRQITDAEAKKIFQTIDQEVADYQNENSLNSKNENSELTTQK